MKILALTPSMPSSPDRGVRIRSHHLLVRLAERHEISLLAIDDRQAGPAETEVLSAFCVRHRVFRMSPLARFVRGARTLLLGRSIREGWFHHPELPVTMEKWLSRTQFDVVLVFSCAMAPYWLRSARARTLPTVVDHIDAESRKWEDFARHARGFRRRIFDLERRRLLTLERAIESKATHSLVVSDSEARALRTVARSSRVLPLPNGVDGDHFARPQLTRRDDPPRLLFLGRMDDGANVDAVMYFAREILPILREERPELRFDVVGARPAPALKALRQTEGVRVIGWVEDLRPYLWQSTLAVAPLRIVQGTQNKILEAMASGLPVVASPLAAQGLERPRGAHIRVEDGPEDFADAVLELVADPVRAQTQAQAALDMLRVEHSWDAATDRLEALLEEATSR